MKKTKSDPIQFRLLLDDYAVLQSLAVAAGRSPKDYVIDLTMARIAAARNEIADTVDVAPSVQRTIRKKAGR